jgi:hypothetical protein
MFTTRCSLFACINIWPCLENGVPVDHSGPKDIGQEDLTVRLEGFRPLFQTPKKSTSMPHMGMSQNLGTLVTPK